MPPPRPLKPGEARRTLANRLGTRLVPRLWQLNTRFGLRPYRAFLVWTRWTGEERGDGDECILRRMELIPTPKMDLSGIAYTGSHVGRVPNGNVNMSEISLDYNADFLRGMWKPCGEAEEVLPEPNDFYYEVVEDDRNENCNQRQKFRIAAFPFLDAEAFMWRVQLERMSEDNERSGRSPFAPPRNGNDFH
jgi:hypothetical protein